MVLVYNRLRINEPLNGMNQIHAVTSEDIDIGHFELKIRYSMDGFVNQNGRDIAQICNNLLVDTIMERMDNCNEDNFDEITVEELDVDCYEIIMRMNTSGFEAESNDRIIQFLYDLYRITAYHLTILSIGINEDYDPMRYLYLRRENQRG